MVSLIVKWNSIKIKILVKLNRINCLQNGKIVL